MVSPYCESVIGRLRVLFGHYYCPDCYRMYCDDKCARRYQMELSIISDVIGQERFDEARKLIAELAVRTSKDDPELERLETCIAFISGED